MKFLGFPRHPPSRVWGVILRLPSSSHCAVWDDAIRQSSIPIFYSGLERGPRKEGSMPVPV